MLDSLITFDSHLPLCHSRRPPIHDGRHAYEGGNNVLLQTIPLLKRFSGQQDRRYRKIKCGVDSTWCKDTALPSQGTRIKRLSIRYEYRRRLKHAFDAEDMLFSFPHLIPVSGQFRGGRSLCDTHYSRGKHG